ncbi:hypothetical protein ACFWGI_32310 [Streptomyces niveus]|uniref:hypothetical protein n=1 Tax=Streptomyces niveus TaxID=193462 RepID=UPI00364812FE
MLNSGELDQSAVNACVNALVDSRGGLLLYDHGLAGREAFIAAGAQLAATAGLPLTLVDAESMRDDTAALLNHLGLRHHTFLSPAEAAHWPAGFTPNGVLAIHTDALLDPAVEEPLLAAAREASRTGHLLIARRPDGVSALDAHTAQTHQLIADSPARYEPGPPSDMSLPEEHRTESRLLRISTGPVAAAVERWRMQPEPPLHLLPSAFGEREADFMEMWLQPFTDEATPPPNRPNRMSEETVRSLQRFLRTLPAERAPSRYEQPDDTSAPDESLANTPRLTGNPSLTEEHENPQHLSATGAPSTSPAPEHGPTYVMRQKTSAERAEGDWLAWATRKERLIHQLTTPTATDTGSMEGGGVSAEELYAALEDPGIQQRLQQQAAIIREQSQSRLDSVQADSLAADADAEHTPGPRRVDHDTTRHTHNQDQTTPERQHRHPGR